MYANVQCNKTVSANDTNSSKFDRTPNFACPNFISLLDLDPVLLSLFNHPTEIADDLLRYAFP